MRYGARRQLMTTLAVVAAVLAMLALWLAFATRQADGQVGFAAFALGAASLVGAFALWHLFTGISRHFRNLERLRGALVMLADNTHAVLPMDRDGDVEVGRLRDALADLVARYAEERATPDRRLGAVLASRAEALVGITEQGQVSLVNAPGKELLGAERVRAGTSVFAALERDSVIAAMARAGDQGQPVEVTLTTVDGGALRARVVGLDEHGGAVLSFPAPGTRHRAELEHDLALHDRPPEVRPAAEATPLRELDVTVVDTETTGLDPARDRIVSLGAVRVHGARIYRGVGFDRLINPGMPIPARSVAVHGITDGMVADADPFPRVFEDFVGLLSGTVLVGHNVAFDLAMLRRECARAGRSWADPPFLDTLLLAAALDLDLPGLSLEALAEFFAVDVHGRHTALGDSLVTAEIYVRMLPRLREAGVTTFGQALALSRRARGVIARQKAAGW